MSATNVFDTKHSDIVHDAQPDYYGRRLATCSSDKTIKIFTIPTEEEQKKQIPPKLIDELKGHRGPVWQVAWAHPSFGSMLASCSFDQEVKIWAESYPTNATPASVAASSVPQRQWKNVHSLLNKSSVNSICWAPSELGPCLASCCSDGSITILTRNPTNPTIWNHERVAEIAHKEGCNSVSWAPSTPAGEILKKPQPINQNEDEDESSSSSAGMNMDQENTRIVKRLVSGGADNKVRIWRFQEEKKEWLCEKELDGHTNWVRDVAWAPNIGLPYDTIASCGNDKKVLIWTKKAGEDDWEKKELPQFSDIVWRLSWNLTGSILAVSCADNKVTLWKEVNDEWVKCGVVSDN